ncbi:hypothetical protein [Sphingomonas sp. GB1N7]|uniref:hypothetical protein n=1 Tax=Parasphingomonas caseinilytica TaxID=3096158 RepID=UPI002FC8D6C6
MRLAKNFVAAVALAGIGVAPASANTYRSNQHVNWTQIDSRPCLFFNLRGVSEADPVLPGEEWFAVPTSNPNYTTFASIILSAKLSNQPVSISTDGTISCGYATAVAISLN